MRHHSQLTRTPLVRKLHTSFYAPLNLSTKILMHTHTHTNTHRHTRTQLHIPTHCESIFIRYYVHVLHFFVFVICETRTKINYCFNSVFIHVAPSLGLRSPYWWPSVTDRRPPDLRTAMLTVASR